MGELELSEDMVLAIADMQPEVDYEYNAPFEYGRTIEHEGHEIRQTLHVEFDHIRGGSSRVISRVWVDGASAGEVLGEAPMPGEYMDAGPLRDLYTRLESRNKELRAEREAQQADSALEILAEIL